MTLGQKRGIALSVFFGVLALAILGIALFDVWIELNWGTEATISRAMRDVHPVVIFATGFLCGGTVLGLGAHFWWNQPLRGTEG